MQNISLGYTFLIISLISSLFFIVILFTTTAAKINSLNTTVLRLSTNIMRVNNKIASKTINPDKVIILNKKIRSIKEKIKLLEQNVRVLNASVTYKYSIKLRHKKIAKRFFILQNRKFLSMLGVNNLDEAVYKIIENSETMKETP